MKMESKLVNLPYINKQKTYYFQYLKSGRRPAALDALWRAASNANLLLEEEINHEQFTRERIAELLFMLDWTA